MEGKQSKHTVWIVVVIIVGLLVACLGTFAGGLVGYAIGRKAAYRGGYMIQPHSPEQRAWEFRRPGPEMPRAPGPRIPDVERYLPHLNEMQGALVLEVVDDSPAGEAGLKTGDIILAVDGQPLGGEELAEIILRHDPGDHIELRVLRRGQERAVEVRLARHPERGGETAWLGILYRMMPAVEFPDLRRFTD